MLEVISINESFGDPEVAGDEHVPLMITWTLTPSVVWHATTQDGQLCCEINVSRIGGQISSVTVLNSPTATPEPVDCVGSWEEDGVPRVSLDLFEPNPDLVPQIDLIKTPCSPSARRNDGYIEIWFQAMAPTKWATSGSVGFGIDDNEQIVAVRVLASAIPESSSLTNVK